MDGIILAGFDLNRYDGKAVVIVNQIIDLTLAAAEIGIGFGGVRDIAPAVLKSATHAAYSEDKLCQFLKQLL